jgi:glycosyltransferase involved in cell wall biosynthesis
VRILVACERVDPEGGTESYLRTLLPALTARGHELLILARTIAQPHAYGTSAHALNWSDEHDPPSPAAAATAAELAHAFAPDVVAAHNVLDAGVLETLGTVAPRVAFHLHDHRPFCPNGDRLYPQGGGICTVAMGAPACGWHSLVNGCAYGPRLSTLALIERRRRVARAVTEFDATIALSHYMAELARRNGVAAERIRIAPPPLAPEAFALAPAARPSADAVLFAGRVMPSKGARSLVRAIARVPAERRPELRIAGEGPDLAATLDEARAQAVRCRALGRLDAAALRRAYDEATLVAVPSLWGEPFGLVGIEALARGRPVAGYDAGAIGEWLPRDGGRLVPRGNEAALAGAIAALLAPDVWAAAATGAFRAAQTYGLEAHVAHIEAIYAGEAT